MREVKFRAWDKKNKCWYGEGDPNNLTFYGFSIFGECTLICPPMVEDLQHLVITQFTGLKDKNGTDIYEGDILKHNPDDDDWNDSVVWWDEKARFEILSLVNYPLDDMAKEYEDENDIFTQNGLNSMERAESNRDCTMFNLVNIVLGTSNPSVIIGNIYEFPEILTNDKI